MIRILIVILILFSCARKEPLTGGEKDIIPPKIIHSVPRSDSTSISDFKTLSFKFSERIERKSFEEHFYTIPFLKHKPEFTWKGWSEVEVFIKDTLDEDITYLVKIGKGFNDLHRFPSDREYQYAITKSDKLDSLKISGKLFTTETSKQLKFALYRQLNLKEYPTYIVDVDDNKRFSFNYLKAGKYIPILFDDQNSNHKPDLDREKIALLTDTIYLNKNLYSEIGTLFFKVDTLEATIDKMDSIGINAARIEFNKVVRLDSSHFFLTDTTGNKYTLNYINSVDAKKVDVFHDKLSDNSYLLNYEELINNNGIPSDTMTYDVEYKPSKSIDTIDFKIESINLSDSVEIKNLDPTIQFKFSKNFVWDNSDTIKITESGNRIPFNTFQPNLRELNIRFQNELEPGKAYKLNASFNTQKSLSNEIVQNSIVRINFFAPKTEEYGWIKLEVQSEKSDSLNVQLYSVKSSKTPFKEKRIPTNKEIILNNIKGGNYLLRLFKDLNENNLHDVGQLKPFKFSEPIHFRQDTIYVRKRWEQSIGKIKIEF